MNQELAMQILLWFIATMAVLLIGGTCSIGIALSIAEERHTKKRRNDLVRPRR